MSRSTIPAPEHQPGQALHGFVITQVTPLPDIRALAYEATHQTTGAKLLHVHCNDEENMFSVGFRTPPEDSTGVAHILEHCVLAGSQKFPVKDAFNELGKRTLNTFLNAMTWPDRTVYPVCSAVKADYFNLAEVYSDLVFNPLITRQTFEREGHHLEVDKKEESPALTISGVVYNEMKGVYSDPEKYISRGLQQSLSPDNPYGVDSGGDPAVIPDLTYEQFVAFHKQYYSPSNARFLLYGNITLEENLAFIERVLQPFDRIEVESTIPDQPLWDAPRTKDLSYPVGPEDSTEDKTYALLAWLTGHSANLEESLMMEVISFALYESPAGPLRKALIDSGLGKDIYPRYGFGSGLRQSYANFGLQGTNPQHVEQIENLILDTLKKVADEGLDADLIESSLHQIAFHTTEIVPPFPLMILYRANPPWYYGGDPKDGLSFSTAIENIRQRYAQDPDCFNAVIRHKLLDNQHRLRLVATPSNTLIDEWEQTFKERMTSLQASLGQEDIEAIERNTEALTQEQNTPDSPEALASLPALALEDIPRDVRTIPVQSRTEGQTEIFEHEVFSNGVGYVGLSFDTRDLSEEDVILLPLLGRATLGMGAGGLGFDAMATRVARHTGGLSYQTFSGRNLDSGDLFERFAVDGKVLQHNAQHLFDILTDTLTAPDTSDLKRLGDLLQETSARAASRVIPSGHSFAYTRAAASLDHTLWRREQWSGITQIKLLKSLAADKDGVAKLAERLADLQRRIFTRARMDIRVAGDPEIVQQTRPMVDKLLASLPAGEAVVARQHGAPPVSAGAGIVIPGQVNYVGQVLQVSNMRSGDAAALEMLSQVLSSEVLYAKLRVQGGAYGGFSFYVPDAGLIPLLSYRDPNLLETFNVYRDLPEHIKTLGITDDTIEASRIGAIGSTDRILSPSQQLQAARSRHLKGITDDDRTSMRQGLFNVSAKDVIERAVPALSEALQKAPMAALGSMERLQEANEALDNALEIITLE